MPPKNLKNKRAAEKDEQKKAVKAKAAQLMSKAKNEPLKPKKIPKPPDCFTVEDLARFKEIYKLYDEDNIEKVDIKYIIVMLRKIGFNPKTAEIKQILSTVLEYDDQDTMELHEWYQIIEQKLAIGDDVEHDVVLGMQALGHDDEETKFCDMETLKNELMEWGEPLMEIEFVDFLKLATKDKTFNPEDGTFNYPKFIENMNDKDERFIKEPINYFKLDQKTLAALALQKAEAEKEAEMKKEAEKLAREEAKRQRMIAQGLLMVESMMGTPSKVKANED